MIRSSINGDTSTNSLFSDCRGFRYPSHTSSDYILPNANDQWIGEHYTEEQAVEAIRDRFKRLIESELALVELKLTEAK